MLLHLFQGVVLCIYALSGLALTQNVFTYPTAGAELKAGDPVRLAWTNTTQELIRLSLYAGTNESDEHYVLSIINGTTNYGDYNWVVPSNLDPTLSYYIGIYGEGGLVFSSPTFTILSGWTDLGSGAIAGIVLGVLAIVVLALVIIRSCRQKRQQKRPEAAGPQQQFVQQQQQHQQHRYPQYRLQPPYIGYTTAGVITPLSPQNLDRHLASQEWFGIRREVSQRQTAYQNVMRQQQQHSHGNGSEAYSDGLSRIPGPRSGNTPIEQGYQSGGGDGRSVMYSDTPMTALDAASESVWHPRV